MRFAQDKDFPYCGRYLFNWINAAVLKKSYPKVWEAFVEVCEDETLAEDALKRGNDPLVTIKDLGCAKNGVYRGRSGGSKDTVFINVPVANKYEKGTGWLVWESTVLHEIVHFARFTGGKGSLFNGKEAGKEFEKKAYGKDVQCDGCYDQCEAA